MSELEDSQLASGDQAQGSSWTRHRRAWILSIIAVVVLGVAAWIGIRGLIAKSDLDSARAMVSQLKTDIVGQDMPAARATFDAISSRTAEARGLTSDPVWRAGELVPWLGRNLTVVREVAAVTDTVVTDVARPLVDIAEEIGPSSIAPKNGAIDIHPFETAGPVLVRANTSVKEALKAAGRIDTSGVISPISEARDKFLSLLEGVAPTVDTLATIVPLLPPALGSEAPRTYVVMFQNPAESRALGGTALSFAVVKVDKGRIDLGATIPAGFANFDRYDTSVIPIPDGAEAVYPAGTFGTFIANATMRPSFTSAAEITREMWRRQFGVDVDGILSIDPVALGYVLRAADPIQLSSGDTIDGKTLVPFLLNKVYQRFNSGNVVDDNRAQDAVYGETVDATFGRLMDGPLEPKILVASLLRGWNEHRILFWSAHRDEQTAFAGIGLNGELPLSDAKTDRVGVYFQDHVGSKLNYYLTTAVRLDQASCARDRQNYRVGVDLTSTVPVDPMKELSPSILGEWQRAGVKPGVQRMIVYLYAPPGSQIIGATVDAEPVALEALHDTDYPVGRVIVSVQSGATVKLSYDLVADGPGKKALEAQVTPMVNPTTVTAGRLDCATVSK